MSVFWCPFAMVDESRGQSLQLEVAHTVGTNHHSAALFVELINYALQGVWAAVEVVAVELHSEASATGVVESQAPASTNAQVLPLRDDVHHPLVFLSQFLDDFSRSVSREIIHHHHVEVELGVLRQRAPDGILNRLGPIANGDDDGGLSLKVVTVHRHIHYALGVDVGACDFQVACTHQFAFFLHLAIAWVNIVKLLLPTLAQVALLLGVEVLANVEQGRCALSAQQEELHVIPTRIGEVGIGKFLHVFLQRDSIEQVDGAEIEVIAHTAVIEVHGGVMDGLPVLDDNAVGIDGCRIHADSHRHHALDGIVAKCDGAILAAHQHIGAFHLCGNSPDGLGTCEVVHTNGLTPLEGKRLVSIHQHIYLFHQRFFTQLLQRHQRRFSSGIGHKAIYTFVLDSIHTILSMDVIFLFISLHQFFQQQVAPLSL